MSDVLGGIEAGGGLADTDFTNGIHMEDWKGPEAYLNSIKTAATMSSSIIGQASAAAGPYAAVAATGLNMVLGSISDGINAYDTQKTVAILKSLKKHLAQVQNPQAKNDLETALDVAITKKTRHRDISIGQASTLQIGKIGVAAYRAGRAIHKKRTGTKGKSRENAADTIIKYLDSKGPEGYIAREIVKAIAKQNFDSILKNSIKESLRS